MEEIIKKCNSYDQQVGCCNTFDGKCNKENCQIYNLLQENAELKEENKKLKTQYNCYACGNCKGTEDYINLEKHHKGLRKVYDKLYTENAKMKQAIEEIREMTKAVRYFPQERFVLIRNKINEVLKDE